MQRHCFIILWLVIESSLNFCFGVTGFPGFNIFSSSSELGLGGAGYLIPSPISTKINPSVADLNRSFVASVINYNAGITSQSAGLSLPWRNGVGTISVRNISYGTFKGYDESSEYNGTYHSGDTWVNTSFSKRIQYLPIRFGASMQYFSSSLKNYTINALIISFGSIMYFKRINGSCGISIHNLGTEIKINNFSEGSIEPKVVISGSKKLAYLPLTIYLDSILEKSKDNKDIFIGGVFNFKNNLQFRWGTSTRKISQNTNQDLLKSIIGASGLGFGFSSGSTVINYGTFIYGSGTSVHGIEVGIKI